MSLMPAQRLERATAAAARKGRLQVGADADIAVFDPATVADRATYAAASLPAVGFKHVLVNGTPVVRDGVLLDATPGRAIVRER
jgi:dihydroorotase